MRHVRVGGQYLPVWVFAMWTRLVGESETGSFAFKRPDRLASKVSAEEDLIK